MKSWEIALNNRDRLYESKIFSQFLNLLIIKWIFNGIRTFPEYSRYDTILWWSKCRIREASKCLGSSLLAQSGFELESSDMSGFDIYPGFLKTLGGNGV